MNALVGTLLNDLTITRQSSAGVDAQLIRVPLYYGPREKYLARVEGDPKLDQKRAITLPAISFEMLGMSYDGDRKLPTTGYIRTTAAASGGKDYAKRTYNPVPYDLRYTVTIYSNNEEDAHKIVEQVLPYFTPSWNVTVKMLDDAPDIKNDIYVELSDVGFDDLYEGDFEKRKVVMYRLELTVKTYFFGPVPEAKVIKLATTNIYTDTGSTSPAVVTTIRPGLTSDGQGTTDITQTIPYTDIEEFDPWDYVVITEENV